MRKLTVVTLLLASPLAWADRPIQLPGSDIEQSLPRPNLPGGDVRPQAPRVSTPAAAQPQQLLERRIRLRRIEVAGGGHYPIATWKPLLEPLTRREIKIGELVAAAKAITRRYQDDGYLISFAYVPNQDFRGGVGRIMLIEGHLREVRSAGDLGVHQARVERWIERLKAEQPLTRASFERFSVLMSRIPGLKMDMVLNPPTTTDGGAVLEMLGKHEMVTTGADFDSRHGNPRGLFNATLASLLGRGEQLQFSYLYPPGDDKEHYRAWNYSQLLGDNGLQLMAGYSHYNASLEDRVVIGPLQYARKRENERVSAGLGIPVLLRRNLTWDVNLRAYTVDDSSRYDLLAPATPYSVKLRSKLRVVGVDTLVQQFAEKQARAGSLAVYKGLNAFDAQSTAPAKKDFTRVLGFGAQQNQFGERMQGVANVSFQWAHDSLPDSEQITYGGANFGRGYPDDQATGDKGWGASYEVNYSFLWQNRWMNQLQPYLVVDGARTHYNANGQPGAKLGSGAVGVRFSNRKQYVLGVEVAKPFADRAIDNDERSPRLNLTLSYQLP